MTVHVDELSSDVTVETEAARTGAAGAAAGRTETPPWQQLDALRALRDRLARDAERTRSDGYGD
jgi:hypothetical protein